MIGPEKWCAEMQYSELTQVEVGNDLPPSRCVVFGFVQVFPLTSAFFALPQHRSFAFLFTKNVVKGVIYSRWRSVDIV